MSELEELVELKDKIDQLQRESDRAAGALEQVMGRLKKEFKCKTLQEAERKLKTLDKKATKAEADFREAMEELEEKWSAFLT